MLTPVVQWMFAPKPLMGWVAQRKYGDTARLPRSKPKIFKKHLVVLES